MRLWRRRKQADRSEYDSLRPEEMDYMLKFIREPPKTDWRRHLDPLDWWMRLLWRLHRVHYRTGRGGRLLDLLIYIGGPARYSRKMMRQARRRERHALKA